MSPPSAQTVLGSRCLAFWSTIAQRPLNRIVCNIYKGWYFQSVFTHRKSFSLHYHAECGAEVEGKEGKYSVFMSRLSMHLLGSAGSCFCLIKGWLMNGATEGDRKIETERKERKSPEPEPYQPPAYTWICVRSLSVFVWIKACFSPHLFFFFWHEEEQLNIASSSHTWGCFFLKGIKGTWSFVEGFLIRRKCEWSSVGPVICIHSIRFIPIRSKPSIHCETKACLRQLLKMFF